jgi:hypothetical protein
MEPDSAGDGCIRATVLNFAGSNLGDFGMIAKCRLIYGGGSRLANCFAE